MVTKYYYDICFLIDIDNTFLYVVKLRMAWLNFFEYEINNDIVSANIDAVLNEEIDVKVEPFGRY